MTLRQSARACSTIVLPLVIIGMLLLSIAACSDESGPSTPLTEGEFLIWPNSFADTVTERTLNPEANRVMVDCPPNYDVRFTFQCDAPWLTLSNAESTDFGVTRDSFAIHYDVNELTPGVYSDSIVIASSKVTNSPQFIEVVCVVEPREPLFYVAPRQVEIKAYSQDEIPPPATIIISSFDDSCRSYSILQHPAWLSISGFTGVTPDTLELLAAPWLAPTGTTIDSLWLSSDEMLNSPMPVVCCLVLPPWLPQTSPLPSFSCLDVLFVDSLRGWIVGFNQQVGYTNGFLAETENGGDSWSVQLYLNAALGEHLGLFAIDRMGDHLWLVGQNATILHSPDLGNTWEEVPADPADPSTVLLDVDFVDAQTGRIVGSNGLILKTADGGESWTSEMSSTSLALWGVHFVDDLTGWTVGQCGSILHTSDGGATWIWQRALSADLRDVFFINSLEGWAVGSSCLAYTANAGETWTNKWDEGVWFHSVFFADDTTGWAVGTGGYILHTANGGSSWAQQPSYSALPLYSVHFVDDLTGWIVGGTGTILYTSSGGKP